MSEPLSVNEPPSTATADDVLDLFKDVKDDTIPIDDKPVRKPREAKVEDKDDKDDKDDDEIELKDPDEEVEKLDLKDKTEEEDEELKIDTPPRKKEVMTKYPNFFKEFPFFEKMMFRDRQYTELFGSYDDAKEVAEKAKILDTFEGDILSGNTEKLLNSVKTTDKKAFDKIVDDYLPTLARVDKEAYFEVIGNVAKHIIKEMVTEGRSSENEDLQKAALLMNQFLFGTSTYTPPKPRVDKKVGNNQDEELEQERIRFTQERFETSRGELQVKVDNVLRATISEHIDPKGEMSSYVKKNAIKDALTMLHSNIGQDATFRKTLDRLWEAAFSSRFDQQSLNRIRAAYLGRSKQVLSTVIKKARAEALKDMTPSSRVSDEEEERTPRNRGPITTGRPRQSSGKLQMEKGESVLDFLSRE